MIPSISIICLFLIIQSCAIFGVDSDWKKIGEGDYSGKEFIYDGNNFYLYSSSRMEIVRVNNNYTLTKKYFTYDPSRSSNYILVSWIVFNDEVYVLFTNSVPTKILNEHEWIEYPIEKDSINIHSIKTVNDILFALTDKGLFKFTAQNTWEKFGTMSSVDSVYDITAIEEKDGIFYSVINNEIKKGLFKLDTDLKYWELLYETESNFNHLLLTKDYTYIGRDRNILRLNNVFNQIDETQGFLGKIDRIMSFNDNLYASYWSLSSGIDVEIGMLQLSNGELNWSTLNTHNAGGSSQFFIYDSNIYIISSRNDRSEIYRKKL